MKTFRIVLLLLAGISLSAMSQISVSSDGSLPDPSSMLDIKSSTQGILIPRIPETSRDLIPAPATGLLIYNSTTNQFNFFNGSVWMQVGSTFMTATTGSGATSGGISVSVNPGVLPDNSAVLDVSDPLRGMLIPRTDPASVISPALGTIIYNSSTNQLNYYQGSFWMEVAATSTGQTAPAGSQDQVGVGVKTDGSGPDPSAILDVSATDKGLLIPRMTSTQRDVILPATGLAIYNSTSNTIEYYSGTGWYLFNVNWVCGMTMIDTRDSQEYNTVLIGTQCWMAESLNYGTMIAANTQMANDGIAEKYCYQNDLLKCNGWGALYQWDEAMQYTTTEGAQGLCPEGWHIPTEAEYDILDAYLGGHSNAGGKMKESGTAHWASPNTGATNSSGFTAIASGDIEYSTSTPWQKLYLQNFLWTSTQYGADNAFDRQPLYINKDSNPYWNPKWLGFSVRCLKN